MASSYTTYDSVTVQYELLAMQEIDVFRRRCMYTHWKSVNRKLKLSLLKNPVSLILKDAHVIHDYAILRKQLYLFYLIQPLEKLPWSSQSIVEEQTIPRNSLFIQPHGAKQFAMNSINHLQ